VANFNKFDKLMSTGNGRQLFNISKYVRVAPWQNQHSARIRRLSVCDKYGSRPVCESAQSDQDPCCSLSFSILVIDCNRTACILNRLRGCAGWSGSMLVANALCWFCHAAAHILVPNKLRNSLES
jgi:hypothetical protein